MSFVFSADFDTSSDCSICFEPCFDNQIASDDLTVTHCNHIFHSSCLIDWNTSGHQAACCCPNCRTELIAFYIDVDNNIIAANLQIPNGLDLELLADQSQIQR